jgi:hypothetical protein
MARRETAYHESGHAVAHYFFPLSGKTTSVTIAEDELGAYNASKHPVNEALGVHSSGRTIRPIVGRAIDHEQVHHELITLLAGPVAGWIFDGERPARLKRALEASTEAAEHADGRDDYSRVFALLDELHPFDSREVLKHISKRELAQASAEELIRTHVKPAWGTHTTERLAEFEALWQETVAFVVERWAHIQAVADALWRKRTLKGEEVREIIERIEDRIQSIPPSVRSALNGLHPGDEEAAK